jgi:hypothetical protein
MNKRFIWIGFLVVVLAGAMGCWTHTHKVNQWIETAPQFTDQDFSGRWQVDTESLGWAAGENRLFLLQNQARLSGSFQGYEILGVAEGNYVILFGLREDVVYFTWQLLYSPQSNAFTGKQCESFVPEKAPSYCTAMSVHKIQ